VNKACGSSIWAPLLLRLRFQGSSLQRPPRLTTPLIPRSSALRSPENTESHFLLACYTRDARPPRSIRRPVLYYTRPSHPSAGPISSPGSSEFDQPPAANSSIIEQSPAMSLVVVATSTLAAATSSISPSSSPLHMLYYHGASSPGQDPGGDGNGECKLLGPFSILVQSALGALALSSLVYKRWRERPQRPLKVWAFDVSKQVFGSVMLHMANLLMSMFSAGQLGIQTTYRPNPCSFYLLNLGIDVSPASSKENAQDR
jgi:hypothetical protein